MSSVFMHNNKSRFRYLKSLLLILPTLFWILLIFGFDLPYIAIITLICAVIHELSHIATAMVLTKSFRFGGSLSGFRLTPKHHLSYKDEALIAAAGPIANFAVFLSTIPYMSHGGYLMDFGIISLMTGISNLLPIEEYDGYRILRCIGFGLGFGELFFKCLRGISFSLISVMTFLALYFMKRLDGGYWVYFLFISILIKTVKKNQGVLFVRKREKKRDFERF